ncbi:MULTISPECIES: hypothetical protein [unclassified Paenibacillus]|uniref:Uncharacterized protein n=1 Tax=Paenibacillus provencensis TaxID=441151 RepID=A0ABW3PS72_9BACL|nr:MULTISPECIES: hypothetical protein [unclassified Paenibacillus]MCM3127692.1 hypothetical protein [Paenibacillus sp. MER 78]SFS39174.1 hypothetical protein SAMN04488601_101270 [Paenibacillus sp. 453mf]
MSRTSDMYEPERRDRENGDAGGFDQFLDALSGTDMLAVDMVDWHEVTTPEARDEETMEETAFDVDRMVNEGLGGGQVTYDNGYIGDSTSDALFDEHELEINKEEGDL